MSRRLCYRFIAVALVTGTLLFLITGRASDLTQVVATAMIHLGLILLSVVMSSGSLSLLPVLGAVGAITILALAAVLQAVDGVAPKGVLDRWAAASGPAREMLFQVAVGARQTDSGGTQLSTEQVVSPEYVSGIEIYAGPAVRCRSEIVGSESSLSIDSAPRDSWRRCV